MHRILFRKIDRDLTWTQDRYACVHAWNIGLKYQSEILRYWSQNKCQLSGNEMSSPSGVQRRDIACPVSVSNHSAIPPPFLYDPTLPSCSRFWLEGFHWIVCKAEKTAKVWRPQLSAAMVWKWFKVSQAFSSRWSSLHVSYYRSQHTEKRLSMSAVNLLTSMPFQVYGNQQQCPNCVMSSAGQAALGCTRREKCMFPLK